MSDTRDSGPTPASPAFVPPDPDNRTYPCSQRLGTFWCVLPEGHTCAHLGPPDRELEHTDFGPGYVSRRGRR